MHATGGSCLQRSWECLLQLQAFEAILAKTVTTFLGELT